MQTLFTIVGSNVALAAGLAVVVLMVTRLWRNPQLAHALWLVVLLKLVTPPLAWVSLPGDWRRADKGGSVADAIRAEPLAASASDLAPRGGEPLVEWAPLPRAARWPAR